MCAQENNNNNNDDDAATNLPPGHDDISSGAESLPSWLARCLSLSDFTAGATGAVYVLRCS